MEAHAGSSDLTFDPDWLDSLSDLFGWEKEINDDFLSLVDEEMKEGSAPIIRAQGEVAAEAVATTMEEDEVDDLWFCESFMKHHSLVLDGTVVEWIRVQVEDLPEQVANMGVIKVHPNNAMRKDSVVVTVRFQEQLYRLAAITKGKASPPFLYLHQPEGVSGDVYLVGLHNGDGDLPKIKGPKRENHGEIVKFNHAVRCLMSALDKRQKVGDDDHELKECMDNVRGHLERKGDTARMFDAAFSEETFSVGEVVACFEGELGVVVSKTPSPNVAISRWAVVANHQSQPNFSEELPQPKVCFGTRGIPIAELGIVMVKTSEKCDVGAWLIAAGNGLAIQEESQGDSRKRLGKCLVSIEWLL
jgi:hypothetical protein